jgi:hypothetical protein
VSGYGVFYYTDLFGRMWMANGRWSRFRVARATPKEPSP